MQSFTGCERNNQEAAGVSVLGAAGALNGLRRAGKLKGRGRCVKITVVYTSWLGFCLCAYAPPGRRPRCAECTARYVKGSGHPSLLARLDEQSCVWGSQVPRAWGVTAEAWESTGRSRPALHSKGAQSWAKSRMPSLCLRCSAPYAVRVGMRGSLQRGTAAAAGRLGVRAKLTHLAPCTGGPKQGQQPWKIMKGMPCRHPPTATACPLT